MTLRSTVPGVVLLALLVPGFPGAGAPGAAERAASPLELRQIREVRVADVAPADDAFVFPNDRPGLHLTFAVDLPQGKRLLEVAQPKKIAASDSSGTDLTTIEEGFSGEREFVEMKQIFFEEDAASEIVMHLALTDRSASTFSLSTTFEATAFASTAPVRFNAGESWAKLDHAAFASAGAEVRFRKSDGFFGEAWGLEVRPASVDTLVESVEIQTEGGAVSNAGSMSDGRTITYFFELEGDVGGSVPVEMTVRTGVETVPLVVDLRDQPLP